MPVSPTSLKIAAVSGLIAIGAGVGVATASAETTPSPSSTSSSTASSGAAAANQGAASTSTDDTGPRGGQKGGRGMDSAALASALALDEAKVTAAVSAAREATRPDAPAQGETRTPPTEAERTARQKAFATAGDLTASDKASVLKAFDAGVLQGGPGPR